MINSILMLGSTYSKNKKINILFAISWVVFMLSGSNLSTGLIFTIINLVAFGLVYAMSRGFKGKYSKKLVSVLSILIWSIIIDIVTYFLYPQFMYGQHILVYIGNGILFNYRYVLINIAVATAVSILSLIRSRIQANASRYCLGEKGRQIDKTLL